jgi:translation elongation factor EF-Tu-like GTPase
MAETEIGVIVHFFDKIGVAVINVTNGPLSVGDTIHIKGHSTDMTVTIESMQIEQDKIQTAKTGDSIGTKTGGKAREHDKVYKVTA